MSDNAYVKVVFARTSLSFYRTDHEILKERTVARPAIGLCTICIGFPAPEMGLRLEQRTSYVREDLLRTLPTSRMRA